MDVTVGSNLAPDRHAPPDAPRVTDGDLLRAFIDVRDQHAFESIVHRHGSMVLGVCRRITGNPHDADDAFQATFLVLARKAPKVRPPEMLGHWLYGVAYRTALKARSVAARRREGERRVAMMNPTQSTPDNAWRDVMPVLDEELNRLPARYRAAIVTCDVEGKPRDQASIELGINAGTLSSRLARGREMLAGRLARRGVALSAVSLASLIGGHAASAAPAAGLVATTVQAGVCMATGGTVAAGAVSAKAAVLSEGVIHAMFITKAKIVATFVVCAALTGAGATVVTQIALAQKAKAPKDDFAPPKVKGDKSDWVKPDLSGTVTELAQDGKQITLITGKGGKGQPPETTTVTLNDKTDITFSNIGPLGDKPAQGYDAQVWLAPGSNGIARQVIYTGRQNTKSPYGDADPVGKVTAVSPDGKKFTVESTVSGGKGGKGENPPQAATVELNITPATKMSFAGVTPGGAKLQEGYTAMVWRDRTTPANAAVVKVFGPEAKGAKKGGNQVGNPDLSAVIAAVSPDGKTLSLDVASKVKGDVPQRTDLKLTEATKLVFNDVGPDGTTPKPGQRVDVWLDPAAANVAKMVQVDSATEKKAGDLQSPVLAVSPDGNKITIEIPAQTKGEEPQHQQVDIAGARIVYSGVRQGEAKPTQGYQAQVWLDPDAKGSAIMVLFTKPRE